MGMCGDTDVKQQPGLMIYWAQKLQLLVNHNLLPVAGAQGSVRGVKAVDIWETGVRNCSLPPKCQQRGFCICTS